MRYASIDIGTNTLRLLIAEPSGRDLRPLVYKRKITRLGGCYKEESGIDAASAERTFAALREFKEEIDSTGAEAVMAFATSVVRRAVNRGWFIDETKRRTGIDVTVISGNEEARLSLLGVLSVLDGTNGRKLVMDIGGGSTEFIASSGGAEIGAWSMELGVVHLTEKYLKSDPPAESELALVAGEALRTINDLKARMRADGVDPGEYSGKSGAEFVGTAGTITTLASIDQDLKEYDRSRINRHTLKKERVAEILRRLSGLRLKEREEVLSLEKGREDLIIPGTAITLLVMGAFGFNEARVSDAGLLEGIIIDRLKPGISSIKYQ